MTPKPKGRPRKPAHERRTTPLYVLLTAKEHAAVRLLASRQGLDVSQVVRSALRAAGAQP